MSELCNAPYRTHVRDDKGEVWEVIRHCEREAGHTGDHWIYQNGERLLYASHV